MGVKVPERSWKYNRCAILLDHGPHGLLHFVGLGHILELQHLHPVHFANGGSAFRVGLVIAIVVLGADIDEADGYRRRSVAGSRTARIVFATRQAQNQRRRQRICQSKLSGTEQALAHYHTFLSNQRCLNPIHCFVFPEGDPASEPRNVAGVAGSPGLAEKSLDRLPVSQFRQCRSPAAGFTGGNKPCRTLHGQNRRSPPALFRRALHREASPGVAAGDP